MLKNLFLDRSKLYSQSVGTPRQRFLRVTIGGRDIILILETFFIPSIGQLKEMH